MFEALFEFFKQILGLGPKENPPVNWPTAGPAIDEHPPVPISAVVKADQDEFVDGWWKNARKMPMHPKRMGLAIAPKGAVVHSTDCMPGTMSGILNRWRDEVGAGNGATFMIGRHPPTMTSAGITDGVVQMAPITRNSNHAGGKNGHGWLKASDGKMIHPNTFYVGIEVDNAGKLVKKDGKWIHKDSGGVIADADVFVDAKGGGWHKYTDYQFEVLGKLLDAIDKSMGEVPAGLTIVPNGTYRSNGVLWADNWRTADGKPCIRWVSHVTLDPLNKTDAGPEMVAWMRARYGIVAAP